MKKRYRGTGFIKPMTKQVVFEEDAVRVAMKLAENQSVNFSEIVRRSLDDYLLTFLNNDKEELQDE